MAGGVETRAYHQPAFVYPEWDAERQYPTPNPRRLTVADMPDPLATRPVVVGLYHPSGAIVYAGADTPQAAADGLVAAVREVRPELPPPPAVTTTTTTTRTPTAP